MDNQLRFKMLLPFWRASCDTQSSNGKRRFDSGLNKVIFAQHIQLKITPTSIRPFLNLARVKANRKKMMEENLFHYWLQIETTTVIDIAHCANWFWVKPLICLGRPKICIYWLSILIYFYLQNNSYWNRLGNESQLSSYGKLVDIDSVPDNLQCDNDKRQSWVVVEETFSLSNASGNKSYMTW